MAGPERVYSAIQGLWHDSTYSFISVSRARMIKLIRDLHLATKSLGDGDDQSQRGTQLLEIYALEIQMYNETRNFKKLKEIYNASNNVRSAIPHPRIMGVIKECGGKMWMGERESAPSFAQLWCITCNRSMEPSQRRFLPVVQ